MCQSCEEDIKWEVVSLRGVEDPSGVAVLKECLYTATRSYKLYRGEEFEHFAGTGERKHRDGMLMEAVFNFPEAMVAANGCLYVCDSSNHCIRKVEVFVEWSPSSHSEAPKSTRDAVRSLMMIRNRRGTLWNQVPKEMLLLVCAHLHRLFWIQPDELPAPVHSTKRQRLN